MPEKKLSLVDELARTILTPALKKRLFSEPYIPFRRYLGCFQMAFETGVVLGHMFRDRMPTFARLFSMPGHEEELIDAIQELARDKLTEAQDADSFIGLAMYAEENRIKAGWQQSGATEAQIEYTVKTLKMKPEQAYKNLWGAVSTSIGFGSAFLELTEKLWKDAYEQEIPRDKWEHMRRFGVVSGDEIPGPYSLAKRRKSCSRSLSSTFPRHGPNCLLISKRAWGARRIVRAAMTHVLSQASQCGRESAAKWCDTPS